MSSYAPGPEQIRSVTLPNGMQALLLANPASPAVVIDGYVCGGAMADPTDLPGVAMFMSALLERGTERNTFAELSDGLESIGADIDFGAGRHSLSFDAKCLAEDLPHVLGLLTDMLARPAFPTDQVEKVRGQLLTGLRQQLDHPRSRAARRFRELAYGADHPYGRPVEGTEASLQAATRDDLVAFYRSQVHPSRGVVAVVGAVGLDTTVEQLARTVGAWQPPAAAPEPAVVTAPELPSATQRDDVNMPGKPQSNIILGHPSLPRKHPDWFAAALANSTLGVFGLMGRLGENVRDRRGLAYYATSRLSGGVGPGPWYAFAGVSPENVNEAVDAILEEMRRLRNEPIPDVELDDVKAYATGSLPVRLETNEALAGVLVDMARYDLGLDYLQRYPELIAQVDADATLAAAQAHLHPDRASVVVAGPPQA